jgi:hypothetical protein
MKLLGISGNAKTSKSDKTQDKYLTAITYMAPAKIAVEWARLNNITVPNFNFCTGSSVGCRENCLFFSGRGQMLSIKQARINKSIFFLQNRDKFTAQLKAELGAFEKKCKKIGKLPAVRLNGTTDLILERIFPNLFNEFSNIQFYDYTKVYSRLLKPIAPNYHLTFSLHEDNLEQAKLVLANKLANVAVVFRPNMPNSFLNSEVLDGNSHDLRFLDKGKGNIVGLIANGKLKKANTNFVIDIAV